MVCQCRVHVVLPTAEVTGDNGHDQDNLSHRCVHKSMVQVFSTHSKVGLSILVTKTNHHQRRL